MYLTQEQSDVFVDACVADQLGQLLFISLFGRDTSVQQFMARLHTSYREGGIEELNLRQSVDGQLAPRTSLRVLVGDAKRLTKLTGRMPRSGLLGNLVHAWIFDPKLLELDHATRSAWLFRRELASSSGDSVDAIELQAVWPLVEELSPVPLMAHWALPTIAYLRGRKALQQPPKVGPIHALRVEIPEDFPAWVSERVQCGDFTARPAGIHAELKRPVAIAPRAAA